MINSLGYVKRIFFVVKSYWKYELFGVFLTIIYAISSSSSPLVSRYLIDGVIANKDILYLATFLLVFLFASLSQPIIGFLKDKIFLKISELITYNLRKKMFERMLFADISFFYNNKKGEVLSKVLNDCQMFSSFLTDFFIIYVTNLAVIIVICIGMLSISVSMTILTLVSISIIGYFINKQGNGFRDLSLIKQKNFDDLCVQVNRCVELFETIKSFVIEDKMRLDFDYINKANKEFNIKIQKRQILINNSVNGLVIIVLAILFCVGILNIKNGVMTVGEVIGLTTYFQLLIQPALQLSSNTINFQKIIPIYDRIKDFIEYETQLNSCKYNNTMIQGDIDIENLYFKYPKKEYQLKDINIKINKGDIIAIIGEAGAGKSTLINLILGFYKASKGKIKIDGINIEDYDIYNLRKNIGYIPQNIQLFNDSILENIRCYDKSISRQKVIDICECIGIDKFVSDLHDNYDTILNEKVELSGGQKQLLSIARALVKDAKILICDEPTSSLDVKNEKKVMDCIFKLRSKCTVIIITHNLKTIVDIKEIYKIQDSTLKKIDNLYLKGEVIGKVDK